MKLAMQHRLALVFAVIAAGAVSCPATAQDYPTRAITMVVTFPAGGPTDGVARVLAQELSERLGQKVVVENRGGAGGMIGAAAVAKSAPDGYTLLLTSPGPLGYYRVLYKSLNYDPVKDFAPIALIGTIPQVIIVSPKLPVKTLKEFIAYAKANPGKVNIGDSGVGTTLHILAAQMAMMTGMSIQHVHYRGAAGSVADVLGGQIEAALSGFTRAAREHECPGCHMDGSDQGTARRADIPRAGDRYRVGTFAHAGCAGQDPAGHHREAQCRYQ